MNTKPSFRKILFGASLSLFLGSILAYANCGAWANGTVAILDSNLPAVVGQPTNSAFQMAKYTGGRIGGVPPPTGGTPPPTGGTSGGQGGGLGMDSPGGPKWTPPTKVEPRANPSDSGDLPSSPPGGGR
jgi:hypothetical protein